MYRSTEQTQKDCIFMLGGCKAYSSSKSLTEGQYVIPFSFKLPENIPGTFHIKTKDASGIEHSMRICYKVEMFLDTDKLGDS